ncbi:MAG: MATE family efflux transporter [Bacteroidales bacterium]|nr:MATE family efflux transporter [Bacteroidales bacterium]
MNQDRTQRDIAGEKSRELGKKPIGKLVWKYFVPAFVGVVVYSLYNIVDRIFIGRGVGAMALSGLSAVYPIMLIVMAFGMLLGIGTGVNVSIAMGKKDPDEAQRFLGNGLVLMIVVSLFVSLLGFLIKTPVLHMFGATEATIAYAQDYLNIILFGSVFQVVGFGMNTIIRSEGNARISMYSMLLSAGANLILDPIFIFVFDLGVKGAAYATILSVIGLDVWVIAHFMSHRAVNRLKSRFLKLEKEIIGRIIAVGMAPFSMQIAASFVMGLYTNQLISHGGDLAVGALGIIFSVSNFLVMSMVAINMASQPIIGFNFGAKDYDRVKRTVRLGIISASIVAVVSTFVVELFPEPLVRLFNTDDPMLFDIAVNGMRIFAIALPVVGFQIVAANFFQSIGKAKVATFLSLLRQLILLAPMLVVLPRLYGLDGVWMATPISDLGSAVITAIFLFIQLKKLGKEDVH